MTNISFSFRFASQKLFCRYPRKDSSGGAIIVVTTAIITSIAKKVGEITPRSNPMLSTINSTSPRVFISVPSVRDSFNERPSARQDNTHHECAKHRMYTHCVGCRGGKALCQRACILIPPSNLITSPFSISFSTICLASAAYSSGRPNRDGNGTC
jgi:hypothetical protein